MNKVSIDEKELNILKAKSKRWDDLEKEIINFYFDENGNERQPDYEDGLLGIGEVAANAFGLM